MRRRSRWLIGATARMVLVLVAVTAVVHFGLDALPGDAASQSLGVTDPARLQAKRAELGLDRPAVARYLDWLTGLTRGDLGRSTVSGVPVADMLSAPLANSLALGAWGALGVAVFGVGGGVLAGVRPGSRVDRVVSGGALAAIASPEFVLATALTAVGATWLGVLPSVSLVPMHGSVWDRPEILVLPGLTIAIIGGGLLARLVRGVTAQHARSPHVESARLNGLSEFQVVRRHLMPAAWGAVAQACAQMLPYLLGGTVVVEKLFGYPGIGSLLVSQIGARDTATVQALALLLAAVAALGFLLADLTGICTDPRRSAVRT